MNFTPHAGFLLFRVLIPAVLILLQTYIYFRFARWAKTSYPDRPWIRRTALVPFVLFNASLLAVMWFRPQFSDVSPWFRWFAIYPFFVWHGACFFLGLILLLVALVKLPFRFAFWVPQIVPAVRRWVQRTTRAPSYVRFSESRRRFLQRSTAVLSVASFGTSAYGAFIGRSDYDVTEASFPVPGLAPELDGFTIAMVSDVHSSIFMTRTDMEGYVKVINGLNADMVVVPGDFVNSNTYEVYPFAEAFSGLHAPHGVYGVMGNHDFFAQQPEIVAREVNDSGVRLLRDEGLVIRKGEARLYLAGVDDTWGPGPAAGKMRVALRRAPDGIPRVLLCHRPYFLRQAAEQVVDLVLSGHTHGGQVVLGRFGRVAITPATLVSPYVAGKYRLGPTHMYVSRGIGTVGLPIRIDCPPEVTRIVLKAAVSPAPPS